MFVVIHGERTKTSMESPKKGDILRFKWSYGKQPKVELTGEYDDMEGDNFLILVVDSSGQRHRFHVLPDDIIS